MYFVFLVNHSKLVFVLADTKYKAPFSLLTLFPTLLYISQWWKLSNALKLILLICIVIFVKLFGPPPPRLRISILYILDLLNVS